MKTVLKTGLILMSIAINGAAYAGQTSVEVLSATVKDKKIADAQVVIQRTGEQSLSTNSDASGKAHIVNSSPDTNDSLIIIKKPGYSTLIAKCPCDGMSYALSPVLKGLDSMRVVLSWGAKPRDLDSHMVYGKDHLFFENKSGTGGNLDVDDTDSYGPETITITKRNDGQSYVYAVHDFSNKLNPHALSLSNSGAKVFIYVGESLVRTFYVPKNINGNLWTVFKMDQDGTLQDINIVSGTMNHSHEMDQRLLPFIDNDLFVKPHVAEQAQINQSNALNIRGESAYKNKRYQEAIDFFTESINLYPYNGKAYGNLGVAFIKTNRTAEAIWANRKALELASGSNAATIRAGANYNIGKIYEASGEFNQALRYYRAAKNEKDNTVYDNAILRVTDKLR